MLRPLHLMLILALVGGHMVVLDHEANFKAHLHNDHCEYCLHASHLGHAAFSPPFTLPVLAHAGGVFSAPPQSVHSHTLIVFSARAPPGVSLSA